MVSSPLTMLAARAHQRELRQAADPDRRPVPDDETPVTRVTLRYAAAADAERLQQLADLDSSRERTPLHAGGARSALVAEVDGRLRAALPLDGGTPLADPFHRGAELVELLRLRAIQLTRS